MTGRVLKLLSCMLICLMTAACSTKILVAGFADKGPGSSLPDPYSPPGTPNGDRVYLADGSFGLFDFVGGIQGTSLRVRSLTAQAQNRTIIFESANVGTPGSAYTFYWKGLKNGGQAAFDCTFGDIDNPGPRLRFANGQVASVGVGGSVFGDIPDGVEHTVFVSIRPGSNTYSFKVSAAGVPAAEFSGSLGSSVADSADKVVAMCSYQGFTPSVGDESYLFDAMLFRKKK